MYSDSESDDEYDAQGRYFHSFSERQLELQSMQGTIRKLKDDVLRQLFEERSKIPHDGVVATPGETDKERMRAYVDRADSPSYLDWRRYRALRLFIELQGFHTGELDLTGRHQTRYNALLRRWEPFSQDLKDLLPHVQSKEVQRLEWDSATWSVKPRVVSVPHIDDETIWLNFCRKWKVPVRALPFADLIEICADTLSIHQELPHPKIQRLTLDHLPPEVLAVIFSHSNVEDARLLSATSRYLHDVGVAHVFSTRRLVMVQPLLWWEAVNFQTVDTLNAGVRQVMTQKRDGCILEVEFLLSRPDICEKMLHLMMGNAWTPNLPSGSPHGDAIIHPTDKSLFRPLVTSFAELLRHVQVVSLDVIRIALTRSVLDGIVQQKPLASLAISFCCASTGLQRYITAAPGPSLYSNITSLTLYMSAGDLDEQHTSWCVLAICPRLRLLHFVNVSPKAPINMPNRDIWPRLQALNNVERVHLAGINWDLNDLIDMFEHAAARGRLRLTHLKISSAWSIAELALVRLLVALRRGRAPLRVLALDGVYPLSLHFFEAIAILFPTLEGLTIIRRDNIRQFESKLCRWDRPIYEYAECMRPLTNLRHFGANFAWDCLALSPYVLKYLELEYDEATDSDDHDADYLFDGNTVVLPFAACCPALESFVLMERVAVYEAKIQRTATGGIDITDKTLAGGFRGQREWNPCHFNASFPFPTDPPIP